MTISLYRLKNTVDKEQVNILRWTNVSMEIYSILINICSHNSPKYDFTLVRMAILKKTRGKIKEPHRRKER